MPEHGQEDRLRGFEARGDAKALLRFLAVMVACSLAIWGVKDLGSWLADSRHESIQAIGVALLILDLMACVALMVFIAHLLVRDWRRFRA